MEEKTARSRKTDAQEPPGFKRFWAVYPRKVGVEEALKKWVRGKCEEIADEIIESVIDHLQWPQWRKLGEDGERWAFVPHPKTFLGNKRWKDARLFKPPDPAEEERRANEEKEQKKNFWEAMDRVGVRPVR